MDTHTDRCKATYGPTPTLLGRPIRCEGIAGHTGQHGHSYAARYWSDSPDHPVSSDPIPPELVGASAEEYRAATAVVYASSWVQRAREGRLPIKDYTR